MRRGLTSTVVVTVLTALAALVLLVWGSSNGAPLVGPPQGTWGPPPVPGIEVSPPEIRLDDGGDGEVTETQEEVLLRLVDLLFLLFMIGVIVVGTTLVKRLLSRDRFEHDPLAAPHEEELAALLEASSDEVRYRALSEGDPRNAVVACWVALEEAVHRSGLREDRSQTASELTSSVLARWDVDQDAISSLAAAYREARFSRHEVSQDQRVRAIDALERIHTDLLARARAMDAGEPATDGDAEGAASPGARDR